jgi:group I intron endonuclease
VIKLMMTIGIYKITNLINKKFYIGSSSNISRRWVNHKCNLNRKDHHNKHLQRAWDKYGKGSFSFEILEICNKDNLLEREQWYLDNLKPWVKDIGYNISKKAEAFIDGYWLGKKRFHMMGKNNPIYKNNINLSGEKNPFHGKRHTEETKLKLSMKNGKSIFQIDKLSMEILERYNSAAEAALKNGICHNNILDCCNKKYKSAGGYYWCYTNEIKDFKTPEYKSQNKKVINITSNIIYESIGDAAKDNNLARQNIAKCCQGKRLSCGGYEWAYLDEYMKEVCV